MSGVFKAIGKVFSAIVGVVKKIWKPILIAAAIYFTAGLALSAMPATASFAAAMPGFAGGGLLGLGIGSGAVAGTGVLTHLAVAIGMGTLGSAGGLVGGALASGTSASALAAAGVSGSAIVSGASGAVASGAAGAVALPAEGVGAATIGAGGAAVAAPAAAAGAAGVGGAAAGKVGMSLAEKFLVASTATNVIGGLTSPSPRDIAEAQKTWVGSFYGVDSKGNGPPQPQASGPQAKSDPLIPLQGSTPPGGGSIQTPIGTPTGPVPSGLPGTTIAGKKPIPANTAAARQAMVNAPTAATAAQPFDYGKQTLIPTVDAPFEATTPGSMGQLDALA